MRRLLVSIVAGMLLVVPLRAQFFMGNNIDLPTPVVSEKISFHASTFGGFKLQDGYYTDSTFKGILPPFGIGVGVVYQNLFLNLGYSLNKNLEITLQHVAWHNGMFYALWGLNGLIIPDIESEGTVYVPSDSSSVFERIPLFASIYAKPLKFVELGVGVGLGKYALSSRFVNPIKSPGFFGSLTIKPVNFLKITWEGYTASCRRNIGVFVGPFKGVEFFANLRYSYYPPQDPFGAYQLFAGVRAEIPSEAIIKPALTEVKIVIKEQATGKPVKIAKIESTDQKFSQLETNELGLASITLKPGVYPIRVSNSPKYSPLNTIIEIPKGEKAMTYEVKLRYSKEYVDYTVILDRAREFLKKRDFVNAEIEITKALKLFSEEEEGLKLRDSLLVAKNALIGEYKSKAENYLQQRKYQDAIYELQRILSFDPENNEVRKKIDSIRVIMLEERKKAEQPVQRPVVTAPPAEAKPKPVQQDSKVSVPDLMDRGKKLFFEGKYSEAKSYFERVLKLEPDNKEAKYYLDKCESYLKMMQK